MKKYKRYFELKEELKNLAKEIRIWKKNRKQGKRQKLGMPLWHVNWKLAGLKYRFRHRHVLYCCDMRGKAYEEVEHKCNTPLDTYYLSRLRKEWLDEEPEVVCSGA